MSTRGPATVATATLALLTLSVLATPRGPAGAAPLPPAPPVALEVGDPVAVARHAALGVTVAPGWLPTGVFGAVDPWGLVDPVDGVRGWADALPRLRLAYDREGRLLVEDAAVVRDPARCYHLARIVRRVGVGLPPPAGPEIAQRIESWLEPPYFSGVPLPRGGGPCTGSDRSGHGFAIEQVEPLACDVPGREVLCVTVAKWRYDFGARDVWTSAHLVFDVTDGSQLGDEELHPGLDLAAFDVLVDEVVCAAGGRCDGVPLREGRVHPTRTALVVELSPGEGADARHGSLRVTVPRSALPIGPPLTTPVTPGGGR
jgi:hypothetical protein